MVRKHPAVAIKNEALRMVRGYLAEFGLTPAARTKVEEVNIPRPPAPGAHLVD